MCITKKQFNEGVIKFIHTYDRLPFLPEDSIEIKIKNKNGETEYRPYKAKKYIKEYYKTQNNMIKELFDKKILTYELVSDITGIKIDALKDMISKKTKKPNIHLRRKLHMFFNKDFYEHLGKYNDRCMDCRWRKCKQPYYGIMSVCSKYKKSTRKRKNK